MQTQALVQRIDYFFQRLKLRYHHALERCFAQPKIIISFAALIVLGTLLMALTTKTELAPSEDQSILFLSLSAPKSTNLNYLEHYTDYLPGIFQHIPETNNFFIVNGMGAVNNAIAGYILKPWAERKRSQAQILKELQGKISHIPGLNAVAFALPSLPGNNGGLPIQFVISSTTANPLLYHASQALKQAAQKSGLFMYVDTDLKFQKPTIDIHINSNKAAALGVSMENIGSALTILLGGNYINRFARDGQSYEVIPQVMASDRSTAEKLKTFYVHTDTGHTVPLASVIDIRYSTQANMLYHFQQLNSATLSGLMMPGKSLAEGLAFLAAQAKTLLPADVGFDYAGQSRQWAQEGYTMLYTFFFAILMIYLVLAAQFESFLDPFIILLSVPLSMLGALLPLHLGLASLNIYTGIGLVTLIGLISKHGILIVAFANQLQRQGETTFDAILQAATLRLRPILMTTLAMVLGVLPLLLASGAGAASRFDIGLVIACGMTIGTLFTLFILPTFYLVFKQSKKDLHHDVMAEQTQSELASL